MLRRCVSRPSICTPWNMSIHSTSTCPPKRVFQCSRWQSSASKPVPAPPARKWHLFLVVGLVGFTGGSWYRIIYRPSQHDRFEAFELVAKEQVSSTASIFTIKPKKSLLAADDYAKAWKAGIWNVQFKQPQLQIVRAYTPLPPLEPQDEDLDTQDPSNLRFLIRRDHRGGEMSDYLHRLPLGSTVELRGPTIEYPISPSVKHVVFVAGGTGIAPALQVAHVMFDGLSEREQKEKTLHILWGNRRREDCLGGYSKTSQSTLTTTDPGLRSWIRSKSSINESPERIKSVQTQDNQNPIVHDLNALAAHYAGRIQVSYFVDEEKTYITSNTLQSALNTINPSSPISISSSTSPDPDTQIIISGPPGFITYLAGPKLWQEGQEIQGPLGGRLAQVLGKEERKEVKVWKV